ncbi:GNAT family N-acetyltransferase [Algoriphagus pacificus]|uniref:N-acetyltransferase n=1 Tax=Algoriphagus pacificus TaxID=2811234 RepID=A0ABS3CFE4_9BACT|nr:GNAT family N-acetyltransferase [Algoriphagus pacificus]MBN7815826.1 N-acetyltransferase [Algoriphagus pacificus]
MEIQHQFDGRKGSFYIEEGAKRFAEMVYVMAGPKKLIIEHTEVDDSLQGQGIGAKLLEALVDYVRKEEIKVLPLCPFAKATFKKRPDLQDVLT